LFSFQPAAFVGDNRRWHDEYRDISADAVWAQIELGAGTRLPFRVFQNGDERCNRTAYGFYVGDRWYPILDDRIPVDLRVRDTFFRHLGGVNFSGTPIPLLIVKVARVIARHPPVATVFAGWTARMVRSVGVWKLLTRKIRPVSFVMHSFMDAADVAPAWEAMQRGEELTDPRLRATQERLQACSYAMAHPETGELVPACVQHGVLDPGQNVALRKLLPLAPVTSQRIRHDVPVTGGGRAGRDV